MNISEEVALKLLQIKAIKLSPQNPYTWASGIKSPIYCDNRILLSFPEIRNWFVEQHVELSKQFGSFDAVAGVATAGIPIGTLLADRLHKPFIYVRSKAKEHGRQNMIEGKYEKGQRVLVVEDLISTGGSSLQAVKSLQEAGIQIVGVVANFQYGLEESKIRFERAGIPLRTLSDYRIMLKVAEKTGYIEPSDLPALQEWRQSPRTWSPVTPPMK